MKTLLIILNLSGGQPAIIDYPDAAACQAARKILSYETVTDSTRSVIRTACVPAP